MYKQFGLLLAILLISSASANFLNLLLDNYKDNDKNNGEIHNKQEFHGSWNDQLYYDNGESIDQGLYNATLYIQDNGQWNVIANYQRFAYDYMFDSGEDSSSGKLPLYYNKISDSGQFSHAEFNTHGRNITKEDVIPIILKRVKKSN